MFLSDYTNINRLLEDVQMGAVFPDGKTFVDCLPKYLPEEIHARYEREKSNPGFDLRQFILDNFELPIPHSDTYESDKSKSVEENIEVLWDILTRQPDKQEGTLIPLPFPYIVPGGRFDEIYYWDSYFTMLGLKASGRHEMIENMVKNFSYLIDNIGYIPNGNRTYFIGRSQPPFYSLMIKLLAEVKGSKILSAYLPELKKEYEYWMKGAKDVNANTPSSGHVVRMPGGELLNRYWDEHDGPRPESYRQDVELANRSDQDHAEIYRHLRAGAESGWDYSCRWFSNKKSFTTIHTTDIAPVDLNCLLWHLEKTLADAYAGRNEQEEAAAYQQLAEERRLAIEKYFWNETEGFYVDYDQVNGHQKDVITLAGTFPLFFTLTNEEKASRVAATLRDKFLKEGGLVSTLETTGQQWDAPNGWAPLQWIAIAGLENYHHHDLASTIATRWIQLNREVYKRTGKLMEKYNVTDTHLEAGGGEYAGQDGFGWTNGVLLALIKKYGE